MVVQDLDVDVEVELDVDVEVELIPANDICHMLFIVFV